ncbi:glycosyltransferase family 4 protein [Salinirussus salinus]|uniref:glycosyltransferase family 4 protein n=1 Tax=Salinirussus salinus TaxID=1198300 RepID=UPI00135BA1AF|nr:glycosyltransferase family 4 protein [Salinirussus salinus]
MTRVLHLITRFLDGGAETTVEHQIEGLLETGSDYELHLGVGREHDAERMRVMEEMGVQTHVFDHIRHYSLVHTIPAVVQVAQFLREQQVDLLHTHSTEAGVIGRWASLLARTPVTIHEIHGDPIAADRQTLLNAFIWIVERLSAPLATTLIVKSERIQELFLRRGIGTQDQYELIYHGVNIEEFSTASPAPLPESTSQLRLLFVGRLQSGKGLFDLLNSFEMLVGRYDVDLLIAGDGPLAPDLKREVKRKSMDATIHFLGYRDDVPRLLAAADVLVLPSYREGTPRVISEALISGVPVVSTRVAGIPEQVTDGESGFLIKPGDVDGLVGALDKLLGSPELRHQMARSCRSEATRFTIDREKKEIVRLYERLLA